MRTIEIEKGWNLCILQHGEESPLENHGAFELAAIEQAVKDWQAKRDFAELAWH